MTPARCKSSLYVSPASTSAPLRRLHVPRPRVRCRAGSQKEDAPVNEDVLAKLRAFEEENQKLKEKLAGKVAEDTGADEASAAAAAKRAARVDGGSMMRETPFGRGKDSKGNWLSESDVDFFTGGQPGEEAQSGLEMTAAEQSTVRRRILIGAGLAAATAAFALVPTESLRLGGRQPCYAYLVPVLRSIALLDDLAVEVQKGELGSVPLVVQRILDKPNEARKNMYTALEFVDASKRQAGRETVGNFVDLVQQADYNKYYDVVGSRSGAALGQYVDFSLKSVRAAAREGRAFLALFDYADVQAAREQLPPPV